MGNGVSIVKSGKPLKGKNGAVEPKNGSIPFLTRGLTQTHSPIFLNQYNCKEILNAYDTILMDCDGVLWEMDQITPIPGVDKTMQKLVKNGKQIIFLSNNSLRSRDSCQKRIKDEVKIDVPKKNIFCIPYLIAVYLKEVVPVRGRVYIIGRKEMSDELSELGIPHIGVGADSDSIPVEPKDLFTQQLFPDIKCVVVGFDSHFSYNKLFKAATYLRNQECVFIGTSDNASVTIAKRVTAPVDGSLVAAVATASGRTPTYLGKPNEHCFECIKKVHPNIKKTRTLVIGDCLATDILFAKRCGMDSLMVLTGQSSLGDVDKHRKHSVSYCLPNYVATSLADLGKFL